LVGDTLSTRQFPYELSIAIEGLDNEYRQRILYALKNVDRLSFSEIRETVDIETPLLSNHLRRLSESLLVEHFYEHVLGDERYSFYRISKFGKNILDNLFKALNKEAITDYPEYYIVSSDQTEDSASEVNTAPLEAIIAGQCEAYNGSLKANSSSDGSIIAQIVKV
jgi:DNA-binding HxlR family transcriptional regulator